VGPALRHWLAPLGASAAVLAVVVAANALASGGSGAGPGPDRDALPLPQVERVTPSLPPDPADEGARTGPRQVDLVGYRALGSRLTVFYRVDQRFDCSTTVSPPLVRERADAVVVRLRRELSGTKGSCPNFPGTHAVELVLDRPLGRRLLEDGGQRGAVVPVVRPPSP